MLSRDLKPVVAKAPVAYRRSSARSVARASSTQGTMLNASVRKQGDAAAAQSASATLSAMRSSKLSTDGADGVHIVAENLSAAWIAATDALMAPGVHAIEPLSITLTVFDEDARPYQSPAVAELIDAELRASHAELEQKKGRRLKYRPLTVSTVANTMFPESIWNPAAPRAALYSTYKKMLPRLKRDGRNKKGLYFERLIDYGSGPEDGNQLEHMIVAFEADVKRVSAFQATVVRPDTDFTKEPYAGFPCLQQIAVSPSATTGTLAITGFYGTQYLFERGYGNLLGLARIGRFLANEMGLKLTRVTCIASHATAGSFGKERGRKLIAAATLASRGS